MISRFWMCCWLLCGALASGSVLASFSALTPLEKNDYTRVSRSQEIAAYMREVVNADPSVRIDSLGQTVQGRPIEALVFADNNAAYEGRSRIKVMIIGSQHGAAEPAGGEAMLVIARDLVAGDLRALRETMDIILIPDANPDGRDLLRRSNANMININTDFVLMSQPESLVLSRALTRYQPHAILDSHESAVLKRQTLAKQGYLTDFYAQFESANNPAVPASLRDYAFNEILPILINKVSQKGLPAHRYVGEITDVRQPITHGGHTLQNFRNMAGMRGTLSFLVETRLDSREDSHPTFRNIRERVGRQLICLRAFLTVVQENQRHMLERVEAARSELASEPVPLKARYVQDPAHPEVAIALRRLDTRQLQTLIFRDHRVLESSDVIGMPRYLAVTDHEDVFKQFLDKHQIKFESSFLTTKAVANQFQPPASLKEGGILINQATKPLTLHPEDLLIDLSQPLGRVALLILDPRSSSTVFRYPEFLPLVKKNTDFFIYPIQQPLARE